VTLSACNTTSNGPTVVSLGQSDVTGTSNFTTINLFNGATATATNVGFLIPTSGFSTSQPSVYRFNVDMRARMRYLLVSVSPQTTALMNVNARLGFPEAIPTTATSGGVNTWVEG